MVTSEPIFPPWEPAMTIQVSKSQFKAKALEYFRLVQASGEPIVITDHGKPALELRPIAHVQHDPFQDLRGRVLRYDDPFEPVGAEDWDALK
jgi:antitoxin (DNA-binding transcriptional repressor) of toxin-antitoxin stability system